MSIETPQYSKENIVAQCTGVDSAFIQERIELLELNQKLNGYCAQRQRRIEIFKEVLTKRLLGIRDGQTNTTEIT
ncbi:hypothetical protein VPHD472_0105 [Vibrio phage D472]